MLTQWFDPEPIFKGLGFAKALVARGHEVEVLTGFPNYPGGELYPGYEVRPWRRENIDGVSVIRVALYPSHDKSALKRVTNYASFAFAAATLGPLLVREPDVIYVYHPPATIGLAAIALKERFGAPIVYDIQDMWPDTIAASGMLTNPLALKTVDTYCRVLYRKCDRIVVLSPGFKRLLEGRGVPAQKIEVIYNWTFEDGETPRSDRELSEEFGFFGRFNVLFAGTMGTGQGLDAVLDAAKILARKKPEIQFVLVGGGVDRERLVERVEREQIDNVLFLPRQEPSAMGPILAAADVLLVHLKDDPLFRVTIPSKTQAYLASGKPILMGVRGDAAELVERAGAGISFEPDNANDLARSVEVVVNLSIEQREAMGLRGREYYQRELSVAVGVERFSRLFETLYDGKGRRSGASGSIKRGIDVFGSAFLLLCAAPIMLGAAGAIRVTMGAPLLFRQQRPGLSGRPFEILKFRTMRAPAAGEDPVASDRDRLTTIGRLLRATSIDELPTLINVLVGDMSLVGPRPLLTQYLDRYTQEQARRHEVKPGITGWAQVNGRNALTWEQKFEHDVWYVDNQSAALDLKILLMTLWKVLRRDGISASGEATMPEFMGSQK